MRSYHNTNNKYNSGKKDNKYYKNKNDNKNMKNNMVNPNYCIVNQYDKDPHSVAPYNFISLHENNFIRYNNFSDLPAHSYLGQDRVNGYIEYEIINHTPLIIGNGKENNQKVNVRRDIPGNTIRGTIRNNLAILGLSNITEYIEDQQFYFRTFNSGKAKEDYVNLLEIKSKKISNEMVSAPHKVKAGYIRKNFNDEYEIIPAKKIDSWKLSYYRISEHYLRNMATTNIACNINFMYSDEILKLIKEETKYNYKITPKEKETISDLESRFTNKLGKKELKYLKGKNKTEIFSDKKSNYIINNIKEAIRDNLTNIEIDRYKSLLNIIKQKSENKKRLLKNRNIYYKPKRVRIGFDLNQNGDICKVGTADECKYTGYLVSSAFISGKLAHYIIPEINNKADTIIISKEKGNIDLIKNYNNDLLRSKKYEIKEGKFQPKEDKFKYYSLPEAQGETKAIFYGYINEKLFFGATPYLRIPYKYSVKDGISNTLKSEKGFSYMDALFGFTERNGKSYKSRLSFEDCILFEEGKEKSFKENYEIILAQPSATNYASYLIQDAYKYGQDIKNYNDDDFQIRGMKQYWLKDFISESSTGNEKMMTEIKPIRAKSLFRGKINFNNLSRDELGLLLWALKVDENCNENIGMGKPYGFGRIEINNIKVFAEDIKKKYSAIIDDYYYKVNVQDMINYYKEFINSNHRIKDGIDNCTPVKELKLIKTHIIDEALSNEARYMQIEFYENNNSRPVNEFSKLISLPNIYEQVKINKSIRKKNTNLLK